MAKAKPNQDKSISAAAKGVTCAIFIQMVPEVRKALDLIAKEENMSRAMVIRGLIWREANRIQAARRAKPAVAE